MTGAPDGTGAPGEAGGIVWLASYPKAGNTWMRLLLMHALNPDAAIWTPDQAIANGGGVPIHRDRIEAECLFDTALLTPDESDLLRPGLNGAAAGAMTTRPFFKTHDAYRLNRHGVPVLGSGAGQAALYLVRDPRDVALSLAAFWNRTVSQAVTVLNDDGACLADSRRRFMPQVAQTTLDWSGHVRSWLDQDRLPVLPIRYEDLRAEPGLWLGRALAFLGRTVIPADIARAVELTAFARLQQAEATHGFIERGKHATVFFRRGQPGEWRTALAPDLVASLEAAHRPMMERLGYACTTDPCENPILG